MKIIKKVWKHTWNFKKIIVSTGILLILILGLVLKKSGKDIKPEHFFAIIVGVMAFVSFPLFQ